MGSRLPYSLYIQELSDWNGGILANMMGIGKRLLLNDSEHEPEMTLTEIEISI
jgi:hypothetical protein